MSSSGRKSTVLRTTIVIAWTALFLAVTAGILAAASQSAPRAGAQPVAEALRAELSRTAALQRADAMPAPVAVR